MRERVSSGWVDGAPDPRAQSRTKLLTAIAPGALLARGADDHIDWDWIIDRARAHKVIALLAARLEDPARLTAEQLSRLEGARAEARQVASAAAHTLAVVTEQLDRAGIPHFITKGLVLCELVYLQSDVRSFSDVDVVVAPEHVDRTAKLLEALDYRLGQVRQTLGVRPAAEELAAARQITRRFYERFDHELPFVPPGRTGLLPVDLHWRIASRRRLAIDTAALWKETRRLAIGGVEVSSLTPEATVIHLAIHATTCPLGGFRLLHLADVAWALYRSSHSSSRLWQLAAEWNVTRQLAVVFEMTGRLFGIPTGAERSAYCTEGRTPSARLARVATASFLIDEPPSSQPARLWKEMLWASTMGCLGHNLRRSIGVRYTRTVWRSRGLVSYRVSASP